MTDRISPDYYRTDTEEEERGRREHLYRELDRLSHSHIVIVVVVVVVVALIATTKADNVFTVVSRKGE